jgi:hypothetical protein
MPEYLYRKTRGGIVGLLSNLIEEACVAAIETGVEALPEELLDEIIVNTRTEPDDDQGAGEAPGPLGQSTAPGEGTKRKRGRNTVFDDRGDASPSRA